MVYLEGVDLVEGIEGEERFIRFGGRQDGGEVYMELRDEVNVREFLPDLLAFARVEGRRVASSEEGAVKLRWVRAFNLTKITLSD